MEATMYAIGGREDARQAFITKTYGWMGIALLISALSAFTAAAFVILPGVDNAVTRASYAFLRAIVNGGAGLIALCVTELALVFILSATLRSLPVWAAAACFVGYSVINGLTLSSIFIIYSIGSIASTFFAAALMFGGMSLYGSITKRNLSTMGHYLMMALLGVIIVSVVNLVSAAIFRARLGMLDWLLSFATVAIFTGLTAYDAQKITRAAERSDGSEAYQKLAIYGALNLYLDFINIFLSLLRLFGKRN